MRTDRPDHIELNFEFGDEEDSSNAAGYMMGSMLGINSATWTRNMIDSTKELITANPNAKERQRARGDQCHGDRRMREPTENPFVPSRNAVSTSTETQHKQMKI